MHGFVNGQGEQPSDVDICPYCGHAVSVTKNGFAFCYFCRRLFAVFDDDDNDDKGDKNG